MINNYLKYFTDWLIPETPVYTEREKAIQIIEQLKDSEGWLTTFANDTSDPNDKAAILKELETATAERVRLEALVSQGAANE